MTDRELLEKAAKAASVPVKGWCMPGARADGWHGMYTGSDDDGAYVRWNPLTDDGDALRLAVKLRLDVMFDGYHIDHASVEVNANTGKETEPWAMESLNGGDPCAATRRAIVRAAAAMSENQS